MDADDIALLNLPSRPALGPDGTMVMALTHPDLEGNRYSGTLQVLGPAAGSTRELTFGPRDSSPVISPDGHTVVFLRAADTGPAQLFSIDLRGGEARKLTSHILGAGPPVFSAEGDRIAYLAPVPEQGRYGTDPGIAAEAEAPRHLDRMSYRRDDKGFVLDKPDQVFVVDIREGGEPLQLTDEPTIVDGPVFLPDGGIGYFRTTAPDRLQCELASVPGSGAAGKAVGRLLARLPGNAGKPTVHGDTIYYLGVGFEGTDSAGRTAGLWSIPVAGGTPHRLTDREVEVDTTSAPIALDEFVLVCVLDRGTVSLRSVPIWADLASLAELPPVIDGRRVVTSFTATAADGGGARVAAVVAGPASPGDVVMADVSAAGRPTDVGPTMTDWAAELRSAGLARQLDIAATAPDGYPVHGFLVLPAGPGPHPVLLVVHGGPHAAYGWGLFDEAQVYAGAGYAVVLPNPRGSSGYGHAHGRTVLGRLGTVDADDVLALLDAALGRPDCDERRVGVMGGSYGGFMTSWLAAKAPERFTAAISERAVNAWDSFAGSSDIGYFFAENYVGADRDAQWTGSPLAYADDIALPLLIIHSEHDWRCPVEQGQRLFVALKRRGAEVEMVLFPGEGHELSRSGRPRHRVQRFAVILDWWRRYLPISPSV